MIDDGDLDQMDKLARTLAFGEHEQLAGEMPPGLRSQVRTNQELTSWTAVRMSNDVVPESRPPVSTRRVHLRVLRPSDYPSLYESAISPSSGYRWRFRGATPSYEVFVGSLYESTLVQYIAEGNRSRLPIGHLVGYNPNHSSGYCYLGIEKLEQTPTMGMMIEATFLFVSLLFRNWSFRKVYAEVLDFNYPQFASGNPEFFNVVGEIPDREYFAGRYWAVKILEFERHHWSAAMDRIEPLLGIRWE